MFNLGFTELLALAAIALVVIGPKQLPQVARVVGRMLGEFRRATGDFNREIYRAEEGLNKQMSKVEEHLDLSKAAEAQRVAKKEKVKPPIPIEGSEASDQNEES